MKEAIAILLVFVGCMSNVIFLENLVRDDPGCGNLITFSQFFFIALEGFIFTSKCGTVRPHISKKNYFFLTVMFFVVNLLNNYAFDFNVPVPLHIIVRSGSLLANMTLGVYIVKKKYPFSKYLSVLLITIGIVVCTIVSGKDVKSTNTRGKPTTSHEDFFWWTIGLMVLCVALFLSAALGIFQESLYKKYGKHSKEVLFYTHLLPLPLFLFISPNIYSHAIIAYESEPYLVLNTFHMPKSILNLIGNVLSQYVCISSVFYLTSNCSSLVVTLVLTLRKFLSLLFSVLYFKNPFTLAHWLGTIFVLIGTIIFTELHKKIYNMTISKDEGTKKLE
ncbi:UDP-galactose transporter, putative [Pediculus humanus corporis]|uniref:UDP-galactose transporter, putative n=1 Tax=Pediculus humanus subsp. corporis TaxID=121224 RepID=E0W3Q5_PEDHC|nr:UDP-galactose transporter, putative [Pediculus humanus corporis]EEB20261.1 UDP-galactose transporter, putative [Pediculus humanus corporis]